MLIRIENFFTFIKNGLESIHSLSTPYTLRNKFCLVSGSLFYKIRIILILYFILII